MPRGLPKRGLSSKHRPGRTVWLSFGLCPMPRLLFVPFQPMPHQEDHLLADTRLVRTGKILFCLAFYMHFLKLIVPITTQQRMASNVNYISH